MHNPPHGTIFFSRSSYSILTVLKIINCECKVHCEEFSEYWQLFSKNSLCSQKSSCTKANENDKYTYIFQCKNIFEFRSQQTYINMEMPIAVYLCKFNPCCSSSWHKNANDSHFFLQVYAMHAYTHVEAILCDERKLLFLQ